MPVSRSSLLRQLQIRGSDRFRATVEPRVLFANTNMADQVTIRVVRGCDLTSEDRSAVHGLFASNYRHANHTYLDKSFEALGHTALGESNGRLVGFAVGDAVRTGLPGFSEPQAVALAGLSCIDPAIRRQGFFKRLSWHAISAPNVIDFTQRFLFAGRMAHVVTYRTMASNTNNSIPRPGSPITDWQREVGVRVAGLFGSEIDPRTFVVRGPGRPIGSPEVEFDISPEDAALFAPVDRQRGDSLLAMAWMPDAPEGW